MEEVNGVSAQAQYATLLSKVKAMEPYLKLLHRDYLLLTSTKIGLTYAVDFHDIWNYAEPLVKFMDDHRKSAPSLSDNEKFMRQIARAKLFFGLKSNSSCVLLPPYVIELKNKIEHVRDRLLKQGGYNINNDIKYQLEKIGNNKIIQDAMDEFQENKEVSQRLLEEIPQFLEENVRGLLFFISGIANQGLSVLDDILSGDDPRVKMSALQWPWLSPVIQEVTTNTSSEWYKHFQKIRPNPESQASNLNDAKAVDLVLKLNEYLIKRGELLVLVSGAPTMKRIFKKQISNLPANYISTKTDGVCIKIENFGDGVPLFRPVETFYYLTLFSAETNEAVLDRLGAELDHVNQVHMLGESIKRLRPTCDECVKNKQSACTFSNKCDNGHIHQQLLNHQAHFEEYERVLLAENRMSIIEPAWRRIVAQKNIYETNLNKTTLTLIEYLANRRSSLDENLYLREEDLQESMDEQIRSALHSITDLTLYQNEIGKFTRTPYRIYFNDQEIEDLLNKVESARNSGDAKSLAQSIKKLIDRAYDETLRSKKQLLWAVLLLCHGLYNQTIELVARTLSTQELDNENEYHFVRALARYEKGDFINVVADCKDNIMKSPDDPRFYHLCGLTIGTQIVTATNMPENASWNIAIKYEKDALDLIRNFKNNDMNFRSAVFNNLAYFHCRRNEPNDLEQAIEFIEKLEKISPDFDKEPEYVNTRGWINKTRSFRETNEERKKYYATQALADFKRSLEIAQKMGLEQKEIDEYKKDISDSEQQLNAYK